MSNLLRWSRRLRIAANLLPMSKAHFVESERAGRFVMNCGREMPPRSGAIWEFEDERPADACSQCNPEPKETR